MNMGSHVDTFLADATRVAQSLDRDVLQRMVSLLAELRERKGRLFLLGAGGGAGHASHAAADFRKLAGIEAYAPTDNVSELTARVNDEGWESTLVEWLRTSHIDRDDMIFVFSVGGGSKDPSVSPHLVTALDLAKQVGATICGVVGRDGGYTSKMADACLVIPTVNEQSVTALTESFQAIVWHLLVSHPELQTQPARWESLD